MRFGLYVPPISPRTAISLATFAPFSPPPAVPPCNCLFSCSFEHKYYTLISSELKTFIYLLFAHFLMPVCPRKGRSNILSHNTSSQILFFHRNLNLQLFAPKGTLSPDCMTVQSENSPRSAELSTLSGALHSQLRSPLSPLSTCRSPRSVPSFARLQFSLNRS